MIYQNIVIGAGQAGLSAAFHLQRRGLLPWQDYVVLDANPGPGGAWQHRWRTLTLGKTHAVAPLPEFPFDNQDSTRPASEVVSEYYAAFEREKNLPVRHGAEVQAVSYDSGIFTAQLADGSSARSRSIINATGTWTNPNWPSYPGRFDGPQVHTNGFIGPEQFTGQRVLVVGAGASATQFIVQLRAAGVDTLWSTRSEPDWRTPTANWGLQVEREVNERTRAGLPPKSVVGTTGLMLNPVMRQAIASGALVSRGKIDFLGPHSVHFADGSTEPIDAILWGTGFSHAHSHLRPLNLHTESGGILIGEDSVSAVELPGMYFVGYGASASTLGATRAGRKAAVAASKFLASVPV
ncbi:flavin-containing monooxygenase [Glutamicibacter sp. NPDC087344]|uniref:flavin-containing monooxygenase n=1 Tax=Glutamicibacter sp. NPDC087344 TaxID=3363994 RepID=UPI0038007CE2